MHTSNILFYIFRFSKFHGDDDIFPCRYQRHSDCDQPLCSSHLINHKPCGFHSSQSRCSITISVCTAAEQSSLLAIWWSWLELVRRETPALQQKGPYASSTRFEYAFRQTCFMPWLKSCQFRNPQTLCFHLSPCKSHRCKEFHAKITSKVLIYGLLVQLQEITISDILYDENIGSILC